MKICQSITGILPNFNRVSIIVWLHYQDFNKALREKGKLELHKHAVCFIEYILEAVNHKTITYFISSVRTLDGV